MGLTLDCTKAEMFCFNPLIDEVQPCNVSKISVYNSQKTHSNLVTLLLFMEITDLFLKYHGGISEICGGKSGVTAGFL